MTTCEQCCYFDPNPVKDRAGNVSFTTAKGSCRKRSDGRIQRHCALFKAWKLTTKRAGKSAQTEFFQRKHESCET